MLNIEQLINKLLEIKHEHGNLRCVTPGFDEADFDDIETVQVIEIEIGEKRQAHNGQHKGCRDDDGVKAVLINF